MGLNRFRTRSEPEEPLRLVTDGEERFDAYLDAGCELDGRLQFQGNVRIDGHVRGEVESAKTVLVSQNARVEAKVTAEFLIVHGTIEGDVEARRKLTLTSSAQVIGDVRTAGVTIDEGAKVRGCIRIGSQDTATGSEPATGTPAAAEQKRPARRPRPRPADAA